jgi:hypothetical protein
MPSVLSCTCRPGGTVKGTKQETLEQELAPLYEITVEEVHALFDLIDDVLCSSLDEALEDSDEGGDGPGRTARLMAERSGRPVGWIENFLASWEFLNEALDRKGGSR